MHAMLGLESLEYNKHGGWRQTWTCDVQDPDNKQNIQVKQDPQLHEVLQVDECKGFSMSKHLKDHFLGRAD